VRRIVWSQDALDEFDALVGYIAGDNPSAALNVAGQIEDAVTGLASMPTGRRGRVAGTYEKVVSSLPYIIAYTLESSPGGDAIVVLRVIHGARDWRKGQWPA